MEGKKKLKIQEIEHGSQDEVCLVCLNKISLHETILVNDCDRLIHNHSQAPFLVGIFYLSKLNKRRYDSHASILKSSLLFVKIPEIETWKLSWFNLLK